MVNLPLDPAAPSDFDFYIGRWTVRHRRLKTRLAGANDWEEFAGECLVHKTLGGYGNVDDNILDLPAGRYRAMSIRSFDPTSARWSIWWLDSRSPGALDVPVVGCFDGDTGIFETRDVFQGKPVVVRFTWIVSDPGRPRWEQAFSADDGRTWELNWTMDFARG